MSPDHRIGFLFVFYENEPRQGELGATTCKQSRLYHHKQTVSVVRGREKQDESTMTSNATSNCPRRSRKGKHGLRRQRSLWTHL